jgi:hypothetical protein
MNATGRAALLRRLKLQKENWGCAAAQPYHSYQ